MRKTEEIIELINYNLWANKRIISWLKSNEKDLLAKKCQSSFSNVLDTANHILDGQIFYYCVLKEQSIERLWGNTAEEIFNGLIEQSEDFYNFKYKRDKYIWIGIILVFSYIGYFFFLIYKRRLIIKRKFRPNFNRIDKKVE